MLQNFFDINAELETLQGLLHIQTSDYGLDGETAIAQIQQRLGAAYAIDLTKSKLTDESVKFSKGIPELIKNIAQVYSHVTAYTQLQRYYNQCSIQPKNVGYLGFAAGSTAQLLAACNNADFIEVLDSPLKAVTAKYDTLSISIERKLTLILLLMYRLGIYEFTGAIADLFLVGVFQGEG